MLYLRHLKDDGTMMFFPLNPDELYYKCEKCGKIIEVEDITGFAFDEKTCLGDYICPECMAEIEEEEELQSEEEFQNRFEETLRKAGLRK